MKLNILAIGAHPDDVELGCSGTIINHIQKGQQVGILDLTEGELGTRGSIESRYAEAKASADLMGVAIRHNLNLGDGYFQNTKENQLKLVAFIRAYQPDIVLANALADRHPDHGKAGKYIADSCFLSGLRKITTQWEGQEQAAWRPARVFHYIQDRFTEPDFIVDISKHFELRMDAIKCFQTQFFNDNTDEPVTYISDPAYLAKVESRASLLGHRIGVRYGEGFHCESTIGFADLDCLSYPELA